ncbi:MAG: hypothetical protein ACOH5I_16870 [Oligoflexus sp.]
MFRIFLRKKLLSGHAEEAPNSKQERPSRQRNRRLYQRYKVNQQHLTVMNDQDILVIRDMSPKGFSSDVSSRAFGRFELNDVYEARMRYLGELHDMSIKVAWKRNKVVGFEVCQAQPATLKFFRRLLRPIQLANSLAKVDAAFMRDTDQGKTWYHGDEGTDLMIWRATNHQIEAWQLICGDQYVEWHSHNGFSSGTIRQDGSSGSGILKSTEELMVRDSDLNDDRLRFAMDLIMAFRYDEKHELMDTLVQYGRQDEKL